jgi:flagellar hook-associated protein 2
MSSTITFSGFNDIDFNTVLNALMTQASQPLTRLQTQQSALETQISSFDTLRSRISTLKSAADGLSTLASVTTVTATSNNAGVIASASSAAVAGHYDVIVNELARTQVTVSTSTTPDADTTVVASGGSLTIGGVAVAITGNTTLQGLADAVNATSGIGVSATVVRTSANTHRLALTSSVSGAANAFTVTNGLTGGTGITFADTDNNGTSGDSAADNAVTATDASISINNITATSTTNTFANVVQGVTLTVSKKDPATTVGVDVAPDPSALATKVEKFVNAYNDTIAFVESQRISAGTGDATSIGRDPLLRQLRSSLRTELLGLHGSGVFTRLSEVGVEFTRDGRLELDRTIFDDAVATNGDGVRQLFAGTGNAFGTVKTLLDGYTNATGLITAAKDRLNKQVDAMEAQIQAVATRLALQRETLQKQFTEADTAISRLKNQSGSLASLASNWS